MPVNTISTYALFQSTLNDIGKAETNLTTEQEQLSSGNASQDFTGMAANAQQYLSLDATIAQTTQYLNDNQIVEARINTTSSVLDQTVSVATSLQSLISQRVSGLSDPSTFDVQLQGMWQQLVGQLNTTVTGQYLFSGTSTNTPAVDATHFPTLQQSGVPDTGYYLGSQQDLTARPQDSTLVTYNVRADAPGFQNIFAALATARTANQNNDTAALQQAVTLVQTGLQQVISTQATVNANKVQFSTIDTNLQNAKLYWQGLQQSIGNTDVISVSTQVAINQGILQAAFQAFAKITSLRLSDYLK